MNIIINIVLDIGHFLTDFQDRLFSVLEFKPKMSSIIQLLVHLKINMKTTLYGSTLVLLGYIMTFNVGRKAADPAVTFENIDGN